MKHVIIISEETPAYGFSRRRYGKPNCMVLYHVRS